VLIKIPAAEEITYPVKQLIEELWKNKVIIMTHQELNEKEIEYFKNLINV